MAASTQYELSDPPTDGITRVAFAPTSNELLVSSWDKSIRLYDVASDRVQTRVDMEASVLDTCFGSDQSVAFAGGLDSQVSQLNLEGSTSKALGAHEKPVKCVVWSSEQRQLISGSWDATLKQWDPRAPKPLVATHIQPSRIFSMDVANYYLVVATAGRHIYIYDTRKLGEPMQQRESSLKYMTRCVRCMPNGEGYVSSSIEGRIAVEFFDASSEAQSKKYAFKCHRQVIDGVDTVYPVNALAFHPIHGTFASGGADGTVSVWDGIARKRIRQYTRYPTSIASLDFSHDGSMLAVASSYTFEEGEKDHAPDSLFIRHISETECKSKGT